MPQPTDPSLYCIEVVTRQWEAMVAWYRDTVGLRTLIRMTDDRYAMLAAGATRLAILGRDVEQSPPAQRHRLVFEVAELATPPARRHSEGFLELKLTDPDGNSVRLICWDR